MANWTIDGILTEPDNVTPWRGYYYIGLYSDTGIAIDTDGSWRAGENRLQTDASTGAASITLPQTNGDEMYVLRFESFRGETKGPWAFTLTSNLKWGDIIDNPNPLPPLPTLAQEIADRIAADQVLQDQIDAGGGGGGGGTDPTAAKKSANLSDLTNKTTARTNLSVYSTSETDVVATSKAAAQATALGFLGPTNGVDDAPAINAALTTYGLVRGMPGQTYTIASSILVPSSTALDMTGCTINSTFVGNLCANKGSVYSGFGYVTATAGDTSFTPTSRTGTFAVGQAITIDGAGAYDGTNISMYAVVTGWNSGTGVVTIDRPLRSSVSVRGCHTYNIDKDVTVKGGYWNRGSNAGSNAAAHSLLFRYVRNLKVDVEKVSSTAGRYAISCAAVWNSQVGIADAAAYKDGIHLMGPAEGFHITRLGGSYGDDAFSITAADYDGGMTDVSGDVIGVSWDNINAASAQSLVKIMPGKDCRIDGVVGGITQGTYVNHGVWIGEDVLAAGTTGGTLGSIDFGTFLGTQLSGTTASQIFLSSPSARLIKGKVIGTLVSGGFAVTTGGTTTASTETLDLEFDATGPGRLITGTNSNMTIKSTVVRGRYAQSSGSSSPINITGGVWSEVNNQMSSLTLTATSLIFNSTGRIRQPAQIVPSVTLLNPSQTVWPTQYRAMYTRFSIDRAMQVRYVNWRLDISSGNIQVGIVKLSGTNLQTVTKVATTGTIAAPTAGDIRTDLGLLNLPAGDYAAFLWVDNTTLACRQAAASGLTALRLSGSTTLTSGGVIDGGTFGWGTQYWACTIEGEN